MSVDFGTTDVGNTPLPISAASLPLPTGAATSALQTQPGVDIGDVTVNNASGVSAVNIQDGGNSITVDGPLTNTELRASAVPVSQLGGTLNNGTQVTITQTATLLVAANVTRKKLIIQGLSAGVFRLGTTGVTSTTGLEIPSGGSYFFDSPNCPTNDIYAIRVTAGSTTVLVQEVV